MKNLKYTLSALIIIVLSSLFTIGCGDDGETTTPNNPGGGTPPNLNMKVNSFYAFTNDSLDTNGTTIRNTRLRTTHSYAAQGTFFGQSNAFQIIAETKDTTTNPHTLVSKDTIYVRYDGGKFYQYGMVQFIDPSQSPTWDLVADFTLATGTQWNIATINTVISGFSVQTVIKGKVAENTPFTTNNTGLSINNYRIEITGESTALGFPIGTTYVDYYIGYADPATNPSGMVRLKLRPVWLQINGSTILRSAGVDQKISYYVIP
jgi:hypothetical protein